MSFIHYLLVGHFDREDDHIRFTKPTPDAAYRPVVLRPIDPERVNWVLREVRGGEAEPVSLPEDWSVWMRDGYLVCDKYTHNEDEVEFVAQLIERTGSIIYDAAAHTEIRLTDWLATNPGRSHPAAPRG